MTLELLLSAVCTCIFAAIVGRQAALTWHLSELFDGVREWAEPIARAPAGHVGRLKRFLAALSLCPFCMTHWTCLAACGLLTGTWATQAWHWTILLPAMWLTAVWLATQVLSRLDRYQPPAPWSKKLNDDLQELEDLEPPKEVSRGWRDGESQEEERK